MCFRETIRCSAEIAIRTVRLVYRCQCKATRCRLADDGPRRPWQTQVPLPEEQVVTEHSSADAATTAVLVSEALQQLSVKHREVIVLHYYENMPVDDIARQLQVGSGTVKSRLHYARKHLGSLLPEEVNHFA